MTFGLSSDGFSKKEQTDIESSLEAYIQDNYYPSYQIRPSESDTSNDVLLITISSELADVWDNLEALYYSQYPSGSQGLQLDNIGEYTSCERLAGVKTVVNCTFVGTVGTIIPIGSIISVTGTSYKFETESEIIIPIVGTIDANVIAQEYGDISVLSGTLTVIETPVSGWASVTNANVQTTLGRYEETDAEYRERRELQLSIGGTSSSEALISNVSDVDNVLDVNIRENRTSNVVDGQPANSYELIVYGGDSAEIAETIWLKGPAGIQAYGTTTEVVVDSQGNNQNIGFTIPTSVPIFIYIDIETNSLFPDDGDDQIKEALTTYASSNLLISDDVIRTRLYSIIYAIPGISNITKLGLTVGTTSDEVEQDITIAYDEIAVFSDDKITIV